MGRSGLSLALLVLAALPSTCILDPHPEPPSDTVPGPPGTGGGAGSTADAAAGNGGTSSGGTGAESNTGGTGIGGTVSITGGAGGSAGASTGGTSGTGAVNGVDAQAGTGGEVGDGAAGTAGASDAAAEIDCSAVGCSPPPMCDVGCTAPCGCCYCAEGEKITNNGASLVCVGGCYAVSDAAASDAEAAD